MPNVAINHYHCERLSEKAERLTLDATVRGKTREIIVDIGRYEKRPVFMIRDLGDLGQYKSERMSELLNQVVHVYAQAQDALTMSENR